MADFGGGIPGQMVSELVDIPKQVVKNTAGALGDIAVGTAEKVVTGGAVTPPSVVGQPSDDPTVGLRQQRETAAKRRLAEVRGELQEYYEQQKKEEEHEEMMAEEQKTQEKKQIEQSKKKQEEQQVLARLSSQYGGTGEVAKSGN